MVVRQKSIIRLAFSYYNMFYLIKNNFSDKTSNRFQIKFKILKFIQLYCSETTCFS